jgi:Uma2 family endonuclease
MPESVKAELVDGIVYMASPVSLLHAEPDSLIQAWLCTYARTYTRSPLDGERAPSFSTARRLSARRGSLHSANGGNASATEQHYLSGAPELVAEIAASSASLDLDQKLSAYLRHGVREYLVWSTLDAEFYWSVLEEGRFVPNPPAADGIIRSRFFPGLHLAVHALLAMEGAAVLAALQSGLQTPEHAAFAGRLASR